MANYYVYILFNHTRTLYVGVTNDLARRLSEHVRKVTPRSTSRYALNQLAYYERFPYIGQAIKREKQIKGWDRAKKVALIESVNPGWEDFASTLVVVPTVLPYTEPEPDRASGPLRPSQIPRSTSE